jgi:regulator of CtrA degradation
MTTGSTGSAFFDKTYNDALALTAEAYAYLCESDNDNIGTQSLSEDLRLRGEAFRLTTRLMQVVGWLLTQRAIHAGDLSASEVANDAQHRLGATRVCRDDSQHYHPTIPSNMSDLLDRSLNLYIRIERLDELMHRNIH